MDKSLLIQKQMQDNVDDLQRELSDLNTWEKQMKSKDHALRESNTGEDDVPEVRSKKLKYAARDSVNQQNSLQRERRDRYKQSRNDSREGRRDKGERREYEKRERNEQPRISNRIKLNDDNAWKSYDAEKALAETEQKTAGSKVSEEEQDNKFQQAIEKKNQGNVFVQKKEWMNALNCYAEAIKIFPYDSTFFANRGLCHLKLNNFYSAEADCTVAVQIDGKYVKAYYRRATARMELKQYKEVKKDLDKILLLDPTNKEAKTMMIRVEKILNVNKAPVSVPEKKAKVLKIEDSEEEDEIPSWVPPLGNWKVIRPVKKPAHLQSQAPMIKIPIKKMEPGESIIPKSLRRFKTRKSEEKKELEAARKIELEKKASIAIEEDVGIASMLGNLEAEKEVSSQKKSEPEKKTLKIEKLEFPDKSRSANERTNLIFTKPEPEDEELVNSKIEVEPKKNGQLITVLHESFESFPAPKNCVQFLFNWKKNESMKFRTDYLKSMEPESLSELFQNSLESHHLSEMLYVLSEGFIKAKRPVFSYLEELSKVKRFRAVVMFLGQSDKQVIQKLFEYCEVVERKSPEEIKRLREKYEL